MAEAPKFEDTLPLDEVVSEEAPKFEDTVAEDDYERDRWEEFKYGFERTPTDVNNAGLWLESRFPLGEIYIGFDGIRYDSPEELYGKEFMSMSDEERREFLLARREAEVNEKYKHVVEGGHADSGYVTAGDLTGVLASPTTLAPVGQSLKAAAGTGFLLGAEYSSLDQLATKGEVDPVEALKTGTIGMVAAPATLAATRGVGKMYSKVRDKATSKAQVKEAGVTVDRMNDEIAFEVAKGTPVEELKGVVPAKLGITPDEAAKAISDSGRKLNIPTVEEAMAITELAAQRGNPTAKSGVVDKFLGVLSTRIKNISEPVFGRLRKLDYDTHVNTHKMLKRVDPFLQSINKLPSEVQKTVNKHLFNGDFDDVAKMLRQHAPHAIDEFKATRAVLDDAHDMLVKAGYKDLGKLENYFPRYVTDLDNLYSKIGGTRKSLIDRALLAKANSEGVASPSALTPEIRAEVIDNVLRGQIPKLEGGKISFAKSRSIERLTDDILEDYASPAESIHTYLRNAVNNAEKRKFFGKHAEHATSSTVDLERSVGNLVNEGDLSPAQADELAELLRSRFGLGEQAPSKFIQGMKNVGYMTTLTNPYSALTQIGDIGVSAYANGIRNTLSSMLTRGKGRVRMEDFGLDDIIAEEFATTGATAKSLHKLFTLSGFRAVDKFGKNVVLNSALKKGKALAKSSKGVQKLSDKYSKAFGGEFTSLVDDLQKGKMTENVKVYLWNELADLQPISMSEVPQKYLDAPNGRLFYALKTYALKQLDILRRDIAQQWAKGNKKEAMRNAVAYSLIVPLSNGTVEETKDFMLGREFRPEEIADNAIGHMFKTFGASDYVTEKYFGDTKGAKVASALGETFSPPIQWMDSVGTDLWNIVDTDAELSTETLRELPLIGKAWYNFFGGGLERFHERELKEQFGEDE